MGIAAAAAAFSKRPLYSFVILFCEEEADKVGAYL